jgi:K(+)-stimulated pyrophosphate-energized sodium pump
MYVVSFLAMAVQEQAAVPPAYVGQDDGRMYLWIALVVGVLALVAALMLARAVIASDTGTPEMRAISDAIREGPRRFCGASTRQSERLQQLWRSCCRIPHVAKDSP